MAGVPNAGFIMLKPGCSRRVVFVRGRCGRTRAACRLARIGLVGYALVVYRCVVVVFSPALRVAGFVAVASCAPPDGWFVLLSAVLGHHLGFYEVPESRN